jgi:hypothetical protein
MNIDRKSLSDIAQFGIEASEISGLQRETHPVPEMKRVCVQGGQFFHSFVRRETKDFNASVSNELAARSST